jgi:hypothetical protein
MKDNYESALESFVAEVNDLIQQYWDEKGYTHARAPVVRINGNGRSYTKLVKEDDGGHGSKSVYCFVRKSENASKGSLVGDILKAASWSAPAKHARGNIFNENRMDAVTQFGAVYMQ